ncbi:antitoxin [Salisediminibacterium beveridgei]|uniref:Programmed cell death antitoxin YdcD n=1 Tax=Salisediminibacterium beveridgei TaxID=632773 RepID=A0A1D7QYQ8_9BACI|nr:antitoxin [Salisediminibacterium beveridgei]AOM84137.1 Programmed cell death antitoxin YdcD [Salisediminibacterium beveridgei]
MSTDYTNQISINLPQNLIQEIDALTEGEGCNRDELIHRELVRFVQLQRNKQIREEMQRGYKEMAKINLNIATESFLVEEEAENALDRLVSGV